MEIQLLKSLSPPAWILHPGCSPSRQVLGRGQHAPLQNWLPGATHLGARWGPAGFCCWTSWAGPAARPVCRGCVRGANHTLQCWLPTYVPRTVQHICRGCASMGSECMLNRFEMCMGQGRWLQLTEHPSRSVLCFHGFHVEGPHTGGLRLHHAKMKSRWNKNGLGVG